MEYSFNHSHSLLSPSDNSDFNLSLQQTMSSLGSLDFEIPGKYEAKQEPLYEPSTVLLFKGVPDTIKEMDILNLCRPFGVLKDIFIARPKRYAFIDFQTIDQAIKCYQTFAKFPPNLQGCTLHIFYTGKDSITKPETLIGIPNRFLLLMFNKDTTNIDSTFIPQLLKPFGKCLGITIFQLKPLQVLVELEDVVQAITAKEALDGKNVRVFYSDEKSFLNEKDFRTEPFFDFKSSSRLVQSNSMPILPIEPICRLDKDIELLKKGHSNYQTFDKKYNFPSDLAPLNQLNRANSSLDTAIQDSEENANNILLVKHLPKNISSRVLFRLFGVCGNVIKVKIFYKKPENALVEYQNSFQANIAKTYLNNCPLYGNNILVMGAKPGIIIDTSNLKKGEENQFIGDYTTSTEHRYRFAGSKNYYNITAPSKVLHLSNLCEDKHEGFYRQLFRQYGSIKKFAFLKGGDKMALMEMENLSEAVSILVNFHNYNIEGKLLKVSFSKYPKIKDFK